MYKFFLGLMTILVLQFSASQFASAGIPMQDKKIEKADQIPAANKNTVQSSIKKQSWVKKVLTKLEPANNSKALAIALTILIPFLGIAVWQDAVTKDFWVTLLLTLLLYLPGLIYAMSIILNDAR